MSDAALDYFAREFKRWLLNGSDETEFQQLLRMEAVGILSRPKVSLERIYEQMKGSK